MLLDVLIDSFRFVAVGITARNGFIYHSYDAGKFIE